MSQAAIHMLQRRWGLPDAAAPVLDRFLPPGPPATPRWT